MAGFEMRTGGKINTGRAREEIHTTSSSGTKTTRDATPGMQALHRYPEHRQAQEEMRDIDLGTLFLYVMGVACLFGLFVMIAGAIGPH
jgi:hypothetical protein